MGPWDVIGNVIVGVIEGERKAKRIEGWLRFLFQMSLSALVAFLVVSGSVMAGSGKAAVGVGLGMMAAGGALVYWFRRAKETKGMMIVVPPEESKYEINHPFDTISRT